MNRRDFVKALGASAVGAGVLSSGVLSAEALARAAQVRHHPLGLQLFTVMTLLDQDFGGTLRKVRRIGYRPVETMGAFGRDPREVRRTFDALGLYSPSQHLMPGTLYQDFAAFNRGAIDRQEVVRRFGKAFAFDRVDDFIAEAIERAGPLGQRYIVWQLLWLPEYGKRELDQFVTAFNKAGDMCAKAGLTFAFHNHETEFAKVGNDVAYDVMIQATDPDRVKLEMDFMWATYAGADPVRYFERFPGRYKLCHLKDRTADGHVAVPGKGVEDFGRLIRAAEKTGIEHYYFEFDQPVHPMQEAADAYAFLAPRL